MPTWRARSAKFTCHLLTCSFDCKVCCQPSICRPVDADLAREIREFRSPTDGETRMFYEIVIAPWWVRLWHGVAFILRDRTWQHVAWHAEDGMAWNAAGMSWHGMLLACHGTRMAWHGTAWRILFPHEHATSMAWHGHGMAWHGMAWPANSAPPLPPHASPCAICLFLLQLHPRGPGGAQGQEQDGEHFIAMRGFGQCAAVANPKGCIAAAAMAANAMAVSALAETAMAPRLPSH